MAGAQAKVRSTAPMDASSAAAAGTQAPGPATAPPKPALSFGAPTLRYAWTRSMWRFRTAAERQAYLRHKVYAKAPLHGVKVDAQGRVYVSMARILDGRVPASLNRIDMVKGRPVLTPFPSWAANRLGQAGALQNVLGFDIDSRNHLWALDMGFAPGTPRALGEAEQKVVVYDLNTGLELARYPIPASVADPDTSFLNDVALDEAQQLLYISDTGVRGRDGAASGLLVYDLQHRSVRRVLDRAAVTRDDGTHPLVVHGEAVFPGQPLRAGINGIALSPDGQRLYWSITSGDALYSVDTRYLRDAALSDRDLEAHVEGPWRIGGGSDGLSIDAAGRVYITNITQDRVQVFDPEAHDSRVVASGPGFIWPDTLGWDRQGGLWVSTNHLNRVFAGQARFDQKAPNFRIWRIQTNTAKGQTASLPGP
jgi:sugar lactone lactonase YvrE